MFACPKIHDVFQILKVWLLERFEFGFVIGFDTIQTIVDIGGELVKSFVVDIVQTFLFDELPQPLNQIEVR